jgi:hypothetical protein
MNDDTDPYGRLDAARLVASDGDYERAREATLEVLGYARKEHKDDLEARASETLEAIEERAL